MGCFRFGWSAGRVPRAALAGATRTTPVGAVLNAAGYTELIPNPSLLCLARSIAGGLEPKRNGYTAGSRKRSGRRGDPAPKNPATNRRFLR